MSTIDRFRETVTRHPGAALAVTAAVLAALGATLYFTVVHKPYAVLFNRLRSNDAATIVAELDKKKIPYRLADGGATILTPRDRIDGTRLAVMNEDLPLKGAVGFELFNKSDMGLTEFAQRINYQRALQGELARTIMGLDGIDSARVHLTTAEASVFRDDRRPAKASVTLTPKPDAKLTVQTVQGVQRLIAAAVPDLAAADVVILNAQGEIVSNDAAPVEAAPPVTDERRAIESYYAARVRKALADLVPTAQATVTVTAQLPSGRPAENLLATWTPGARDFGLAVTVSSLAATDPAVENEIRKVALSAIGADPALHDSVLISVSAAMLQPLAATPLAPAAPPAAAPPAAADRPASALVPPRVTLEVILPILAVLIALAALLHWWGGSVRKLTPRQKAAYSRRLRVLLDAGEVHAAPPL